jgi:hypothetical protein
MCGEPNVKQGELGISSQFSATRTRRTKQCHYSEIVADRDEMTSRCELETDSDTIAFPNNDKRYSMMRS